MTDITSIIRDLEQQKAGIDKALAALREIGGDAGGTTRAAAKGAGAPRKRQMSEEGRRRIGEAAKKRWAAVRRGQRKAAREAATMPDWVLTSPTTKRKA